MKGEIVCGILVTAGCFTNVAQAQGSVTLYGTIDTGIEYANVGGVTTVRTDSSNVIPSRWGLTGQEPLWGGTSVVFKLENGFNSSTGTALQNGALFGREAWVGLKSDLGKLQIGVNYSALDTTFLIYTMGFGWGNASSNFIFTPVLRTNNSVRYESPKIYGFSMIATYALGANGSATLPRTFGNSASVDLTYATGGFSASADFMTQVYSPAKTLTATSSTATGNYSVFAAKYDFHFLAVGGIFQMYRGGAGALNYTTNANVNNNFYEVVVNVPINISNLLFSFGQYKDLANSAGNATSYGVRYVYPISRRTLLYAGVTEIVNGPAASFTDNSTAAAGVPIGAPGRNVTAGTIGMTHQF
ncbi:porin [Paraburkholderia sediminicola]|uniref:porin n=1 Tax=Paraburkholderia sediminicola TaxID=458836 RepID=UPI000EB4D3CC